MVAGASTPRKHSYDVVIIGGAMIGSSIAWFLSDPNSNNAAFDGSVLVVERDPTYENSSTSRTNSCMRQQFSNELNIKISQFAAEFVRNFADYMGNDPEAPELAVNHFGYMYLAPSGVHVRSDGDVYLAGCAPDDDRAVDHNNLRMDRDIWEEKVWPALAHRIPAFERTKVMTQWAGHYAYNTLDHNVVVGPHNEVSNFIFANGFSGHGLQQSPAIGRGVAELITYNEYRTLDLTPLGYDRIARREPFTETAII